MPQYHDTRVTTTRALRGATPDTTTPAFPLREPFGARHPPTPVNGDDDARHRSKTGLQTSESTLSHLERQVCKPRQARCHTWKARRANLGKDVAKPRKPGVQTSERMLPNLESQVCKPPKPFGQTHAAVLTNPRCHTAFRGKTAAKPKVKVPKWIGREVRTYPSSRPVREAQKGGLNRTAGPPQPPSLLLEM